jgi:hypothetical protein
MAALITALISFVNLTLSKEQKTSEFRQAWIDGLRADLAIFFSSSRALCRVMQEARSPHSKDEDVECFRFNREQVSNMRIEAANALYRIKLRLNKGESEHTELNRLLYEITTIQNKINIDKGTDYNPALDAIEGTSSFAQDILKAEWEVVKSGEESFQFARNKVMPVIGAVSLLLLAFLVFSSPEPEPNKSIQSTAEATAN